MNLTPQQLATLKTHIDNSADLNVLPNNSDGWVEVAALLNVEAAPVVVVWKTAVTWDEIMLNGMDWARVDNLSVGKARIWDWMFNNDGRSMNPAKANIRAGIDAAWVGTAADLAVRAAVYVHCKRNATRAENLLATGTGTEADPKTLGSGAEGGVTPGDVDRALNPGG